MKTKSTSKTGLSRRNLLFASSALGLTLLLPRRKSRAASPTAPRFLISIVATGGMDPTMLFDARPRAMTAAGKIHNPLNEDPTPWVGANGQTALSPSTAAALVPHRDRFSVVNGVVMSTSFDGHDQNTNLLLAGNPFGGTSFLADLNAEATAPLDYVRLGSVVATLQDSRTIQLTPPGLQQLVQGVSGLGGGASSLDDYLAKESTRLGNPKTRFGAGVLALQDASVASKELQQRIGSIQLEDQADPLEAQLAMIREVFRRDIARGAMFAFANDLQIDNHAPAAAKAQAPTYVEIARRLARVFDYLAKTPYDDQHSLLDVTTVVVGSEFGRTMRQPGAPIDNTGTDHNPLSNSILVGGAGIKGGLVIGASDYQAADETLSGAHLALDPDGLKVMGRPFDFTSFAPRTDRPAELAIRDYLQIGSVVNTVYSLFDIDREKWRLVERNGEPCPVLSNLLA